MIMICLAYFRPGRAGKVLDHPVSKRVNGRMYEVCFTKSGSKSRRLLTLTCLFEIMSLKNRSHR